MSDEELGRLSHEPSSFGVLETARGCLPLTELTVSARVEALTAEIELAQTFKNSLDVPLEATYIFPLPDRAAVTRFQMEVAGRVIEGVIDERGRARANYEQAIAAGHRAAIAEEDRAGVFTLRVGNLLPQEAAVVRLSLVGPLPFDEGEVTFCFPLVVAPRYMPGVGLPGPQAGSGSAGDTDAVPDASRISPPILLPGFPNPVQLAIEVSVDGGGVPVSALRSSLHSAIISESQGKHRVQLQPGERLNRDFILRWRLGDTQIRSSAVLAMDAEGADATCLITVVPPQAEGSTSRPRDVVFVLDRSGSMGGWKMVAARRAVARMVDTLGARDRFAVLAFDDRIDTPSTLARDVLVAASDRHRFRAVEFLASIDARGGTELMAPLEAGAKLLHGADSERDRVLILVTDGQVGNEDEILRQLTKPMQHVRVFALGIDSAVNAAFLRRLAAMGGGACELVESEERLDEVMAKVHRRIAQPVVTGLHLDGDGVRLSADSMAPARLPDLFTGAPLLVAVRLDQAASGAILIKGQTPAGRPWSQTVPLQRSGGAAVPAIWARAHIRDLEDRYASGSGDLETLEQRIVAVSLRHRVLSRFTAFLAVDRSARVNPDGTPRMVTQAVEAPADWEMLDSCKSTAAPSMSPPPPPAQMVVGAAPAAPADGVVMSKRRQAAPPKARVPRNVMSERASAVRCEESAAESRQDEAPVLDFAPYLQRIRDLADAVERSTASNDMSGLDLAIARLRELIEDLRSVFPTAPMLAALTRAVENLQRLLGATDAVAEQGQQAAVELRALAVPQGAPPETSHGSPSRAAQRWQFWKR
jgi:Ca-activated chloride channel family protein